MKLFCDTVVVPSIFFLSVFAFFAQSACADESAQGDSSVVEIEESQEIQADPSVGQIQKVQKDPSAARGKPLQFKISGKGAFNFVMGSQIEKGSYSFSAKQKGGIAPGGGVQGYTFGSPFFNLNKDAGRMFVLNGLSISFAASGATDEGIDYGLHIALKDNEDDQFGAWERYIRLGTQDMGYILVGNTAGAEDVLSVDVHSTQVGSGGIKGAGSRLFQKTYGVESGFDLGGRLAGGGTAGGTKFTYLTPKWEGFQAGISYTPDSKHVGAMKLNTASSPEGLTYPYQKDSFGLGLQYDCQLASENKLSLSVAGLVGQVEQEEKMGLTDGQSLARQRVAAFAVGAAWDWDALRVAYQFVYNGKSGQLTQDSLEPVDPYVDNVSDPKSYCASRATGGYVHGVGARYRLDRFLFSGGLYFSSRKTGFEDETGSVGVASGRILTAGIEYKVTDLLSIYGEYAGYDFDNPHALHEARMIAQNAPRGVAKGAKSNRAQMMIVGTKVRFSSM